MRLFSTVACKVLAGNSSNEMEVIMEGNCQVFGFNIKANITEGASYKQLFSIEIYNVPTPIASQKLIKVNEFAIMIASEDEQTLEAVSYFELNEGYPDIQFTNPANYLIINNDEPI